VDAQRPCELVECPDVLDVHFGRLNEQGKLGLQRRRKRVKSGLLRFPASFWIHGLDTTVVLALDAAQLQLKAILPVAVSALLEAQDLLAGASMTLAERCIARIEVNEWRPRGNPRERLGELSVLAATVGYEEDSRLATRRTRGWLRKRSRPGLPQPTWLTRWNSSGNTRPFRWRSGRVSTVSGIRSNSCESSGPLRRAANASGATALQK
jgi:hypothetical protein